MGLRRFHVLSAIPTHECNLLNALFWLRFQPHYFQFLFVKLEVTSFLWAMLLNSTAFLSHSITV